MLANRLTLNLIKSTLIIINLKKDMTVNPISINCSGGMIKSQSQAKYLTFLIDNLNLIFCTHKIYRIQDSMLNWNIKQIKIFFTAKSFDINLLFILFEIACGLSAWRNTCSTYLSKLA